MSLQHTIEDALNVEEPTLSKALAKGRNKMIEEVEHLMRGFSPTP